MEDVTLMEYLQMGPFPLPINPPANPEPNTPNAQYNYSQIGAIGQWQEFNLPAIMQRYGNLMTATMIHSNPFINSPITSRPTKKTIWYAISLQMMAKTRYALRATFDRLQTTNQMNGITPLEFGLGAMAENPGDLVPDTAYYLRAIQNEGEGPNRAPGEVKPSWKWSNSLRDGTPYEQKEFKQVLSQVNHYMKQHQARYGLVLTDRELVAIRRLNYDGDIELSRPIPWDTRGTVEHPRLTVLLALWYIGMLAAQDEGDESWQL
ncbi:hypothetical protein FQN50_002488 [Emmonsiellopsis sp. PD_5]|nr:hypothetical protein FQN50_002488 [Emmonsiellopsis sp. PD_5]